MQVRRDKATMAGVAIKNYISIENTTGNMEKEFTERIEVMGERKKLDIVMFPWLAYGHITPYFELSKRLAEKGHHISFVSTPRNIDRLPKIPKHLQHLINLVKLSFPPDLEIKGLDSDAESMADIPFTKLPLMSMAYDSLQGPLAEFLDSHPPDWIFYDSFSYFVPPIIAKLSEKYGRNIYQGFFYIVSACSTCFLEAPTAIDMLDHAARSQIEDLLLPRKWIPFPNNLAYRLYEVLPLIDHIIQVDGQIKTDFSDGVRSLLKACDAILIQSCKELEGEYLELLQELHAKPVLPTGFLTPSIQDVVSRENHDEQEWQFTKQWLDKHGKGSVLYIALGSEVTPNQKMLDELANGLELSKVPFFWALRKPKVGETSLELPDRFEERTRGQGLMWRSWAPQVLILEHESVGGFLTHCGWNSTLDGLQFGKSFIMLPFYGDQGINSRFLSDANIGVEIPRDECSGLFTRQSVGETLNLVLVDEAGKIYREKAKEMRKTLGDRNLHKGSSSNH
ncbi:putative UDP-rhamnose:rhamnosyltransferase 1 [Drosera capensis]